jgi:CheY-like chemotaxis protein
MKILLIEDSRFLRIAIEKSLVKAGYEVTGLSDGREVLNAARNGNPDLIILDMMLPGLEGTCVLKELKSDASTLAIPVIVLTGLSQKNEAKMKKAGAAFYLEKTSIGLEKNSEGLIQVIESVIGKPPARAEILEQPTLPVAIAAAAAQEEAAVVGGPR